MRHFDYHDDIFFAEGVDLTKLAAEVGTPTYVYARATIDRHYRVFDQAFAGHPHLCCYAVKANPSAAVMNLVARMGAGADVVSGGELARAMRAGIPAERIVFSGVAKTREEMAFALNQGILSFNVESEPELVVLSDVATSLGKVAPVSLRVNPDVDAKTHPYIATGLKTSKFGIPIDESKRIADLARSLAGVSMNGIDCHIGSQLTSIEPFMEALECILELVDELKARGHHIEHIDLGGGLGISYSGETPPSPSELGARVVERMKGRSERIILEPGRVIVGNAGILLTRVLYIKPTPQKTFVIVDAGMNDLLRPSLYGAHHEIWPVVRRETEQLRVDVVGPICESSDAFAKDRLLAKTEPGDLLAIMSSGAYGFSMASTYNSRPLAAEVVVTGDRFHVVRTRGTFESLIAGESIPAWEDDTR